MSDANWDAIKAERAEKKQYKDEYEEKKTANLESLYTKFSELLPSDISTEFIDRCVKVHSQLPMFDNPYLCQTREDNLLLTVVFVVLSELQYKKEQGYGRSWCKRGELDVFFNVARKFDRLENMMIGEGKDEVGEGKLDTVGDLTNYGLLWTTFYLRENPEEFLNWASQYSRGLLK